VTQWPAAFGRFCYEFAVGDTPEFTIGVAVVIVGAWALGRVLGPATFWFIPAAVIVLLGLSLWHGTSGSQK
jgi:hypothetical protein